MKTTMQSTSDGLSWPQGLFPSIALANRSARNELRKLAT